MVIHDIFKNWCKFCVVNEVKEYFFICCDVYFNVSFDKVKKTFMLKFEILSPVPFFGFIVINSLEKQNVTWTSANKAGFFYQKHRSEINICNLFCLSFDCFVSISSFNFLDFDSVGLTLSIESIDFLLSLVQETFIWEIKWWHTLKIVIIFSEDFCRFRVIEKVIMFQISIME